MKRAAQHYHQINRGLVSKGARRRMDGVWTGVPLGRQEKWDKGEEKVDKGGITQRKSTCSLLPTPLPHCSRRAPCTLQSRSTRSAMAAAAALRESSSRCWGCCPFRLSVSQLSPCNPEGFFTWFGRKLGSDRKVLSCYFLETFVIL